MRLRWRSPLMVLAIVCLHAQVAAGANPHLVRGKKLYSQAEDERAVAELKRALASKKGPRQERAEINLYLGLATFDLLQTTEAERYFREALRINPKIALPAGLSPKVKGFFKAIKDSAKPATDDPSTLRNDPPPTTPPPDPPPTAPAVTPPFLKDTNEREPPSHWSAYWPAWTTLGVGVAAAGTAVALVLLARDRAGRADDLRLTYDEAKPYRDSAESLLLGTNILWGVAGAAAIVSGILFYMGYRWSSSPAVSVAPLRGGVLLRLGEIRW